LVLKDGQIIEQGSHKDLLALNGVFATMWANQISSSGDPASSIKDQGDNKEAVSGHIGDQNESATHVTAEDEAPREVATSAALVDTPEAIPAALDLMENTDDAPPVPFKEAVVYPADESAPAPLAFPSSEDTRGLPSEATSSQIGGVVTFGDTANSPPSRTATPDPEAEQKRKRISSQNLQRFARKMSLTTRRQGSGTFVPGIKRDASSTQPDDTGTGSTRNSNDSPVGSVQSDVGKGRDSKKEKKEKRKTIF
jgi:hypothetical protein